MSRLEDNATQLREDWINGNRNDVLELLEKRAYPALIAATVAGGETLIEQQAGQEIMKNLVRCQIA